VKIEEAIKVLPNSPGVYQYFDKNGVIIYIGKAKHLKKRVQSYFNKNQDSAKTRILVRQIVDLKFIVVDTEFDALILENSLIKKHQPKYNIQLKDDKTYPWICIKKERFPRIFSTRTMIKDGSKYYGPYPHLKVMQALLEMIRKIYPLRNCAYDLSAVNIEKGKFRACLEYQIGNCKAPCIDAQTEEDYAQTIERIKDILKGNTGSVVKHLKSEMLGYAEVLDFEKANRVKEKLQLIEKYQSKSTIVSTSIQNLEVFSMVLEEGIGAVNYMKVHNGAIINSHTVDVKLKLEEKPEDILPGIILNLRERFSSNSAEIIVPYVLPIDIGVKVIVPQKGDKKALLELSQKNIKYYLLDKRKRSTLIDPERHTKRVLEQIQKDLRLKELPRHIECFDNSNHQGTDAVAACVVFKNAKPAKKEYRHFNIKTVVGPDDFASMEEVVYRRYKRLKEEEKPLPQLIIVDGGKGQLSSGVKSLKKLDLYGQIAIVGIAKRLEEIFFPGDTIPLYIDKKSESLKVIQQLRNEAHRFGITHHRNKKTKRVKQTALTSIEGIGEATAKELLRAFKSVKRIKALSLQELSKVIGAAKAKLIIQAFTDK